MSEHRETYERFLNVLTSPGPLPLPANTALSAISHYVGTCDLQELPNLINTVLSSHSLLQSIPTIQQRQNAIQTAFEGATSGRLALEQQRHAKSYFSACRSKQRASAWALSVCKELNKVGLKPRNHTYTSFYAAIGFYRGLKKLESQAGWGEAIRNLEDELVLSLARLEGNSKQEVITSDHELELTAITLPLLPAEKAQLLMRMDVRSKFMDKFLRLIRYSSATGDGDEAEAVASERNAILAKAFALSFDLVINADTKGKEKAWYDAEAFAKELLHALEEGGQASQGAMAIVLPPGNAIIRLLADDEAGVAPASDSQGKTKQIASNFVIALAKLSNSSKSGPQASHIPGYDQFLYGCLDLLEAGSKDGIPSNRLIRRLVQMGCDDDFRMVQDAFILNVAEQLLATISSKTLRDEVLPICERYLRKDSFVSAALEAAHSLVLACINGSATATGRGIQGSFAEQLIRWYITCVVDHTLSGLLNKEQSIVAYYAVTRVAFLQSNDLGIHCIQYLDISIRHPSASSALGSIQILRTALIATLPLVAAPHLRNVLHDIILPMVINLSVGSGEREELVSDVFREINEGLGDYSKIIGIRFWTEYSDRFRTRQAVLAKL